MKIEKYCYEGYYGVKSFCDLEIETIKVIIKERNDNPGTSITNMIVYLANKICKEYNIDKHRLMLIEKYQYPNQRAEYSLV
jgi:hypothetical protein